MGPVIISTWEMTVYLVVLWAGCLTMARIYPKRRRPLFEALLFTLLICCVALSVAVVAAWDGGRPTHWPAPADPTTAPAQ